MARQIINTTAAEFKSLAISFQIQAAIDYRAVERCRERGMLDEMKEWMAFSADSSARARLYRDRYIAMIKGELK